MKQWFQRFAGFFPYPDNYTTIDLETSGLDPTQHLVCSIGHTVVRDRQPVHNEETYLNWPAYVADQRLDAGVLRADLEQTAHALNSKQKPFHHTWERLAQYGQDPKTVLEKYLGIFEQAERDREVLVAHNGWQFDVEFLQSAFYTWVFDSQTAFDFDPQLLYDTGVAEKASQLSDNYSPLPLVGETLKQFFWRLGQARARGVYWSLDKHCEEVYGLLHKAGVQPGDCHRPAVDSFLVHRLMEEHRQLAGVA